MGLGTASVCLSVLVLNFHHKGPTSRMPRWVRVVFLHHLARLLGFTPPPCPAPAAVTPPLRPDRRASRLRSHHNNFSDDALGADDDLVEVVRGGFRSPPSNHRHKGRGALPVEQLLLKDSLGYHPHPHHQVNNRPRREEAGRGRTGEGGIMEAEEVIKEWQMLARVLDRLFFIIVFIVILASALFLLLSPWYVGPKSFF